MPHGSGNWRQGGGVEGREYLELLLVMAVIVVGSAARVGEEDWEEGQWREV